MINLTEILKAKHRIQKYIQNTPLMLSETLSQISGANVYVKLESLQKTGAFKVRGIYNKIISSGNFEKEAGFITASSGNHGLALAYVCKEMGLKATVVVPAYTPIVKINAIKRENAELILFGNNWNESFQYAEKLALQTKANIIHPFDDDDVINGQGTIALEILDNITENPDYFLASIGGGSMLASNAIVFKELSPKTKIIGLQTFGADAMYQSVKSRSIVTLPKITSIVESFATKQVTMKTFEPILQNVDQILRLNDEECIDAAIFMLERANILLELSASICIAALIKNKFSFKPKDNIVMVLCGGNFDLHKLAKTIINQKQQ